MEWLKELLKFLSDETNRDILAFLGAGIVAVAGGAWAAYVHFSKRKSSNSTQVTARDGSVASGRDTTVGRDLKTAGRNINIGITLEEHEASLKRKEEEVRKEYAASAEDKEKRALLEMELAALEQKRTHLEESLQATQKMYADTIKLFNEKLSAQLSPDRIEQAKTAITEGDPALAESLLQEVGASSAEASYGLGLLAKDRVDYEKAWQALNRAAQLAPDNSLYLNEAGTMGHTLGRYDSAIEFFEKALAIDLKTHGPEHPDVARNWNNLGEAWSKKGETDKAIEYYEKALASVLKTLGPDHFTVAICWNNLGSAWQAKGEYDKAIGFYEKALASALKTYGPDHPQIAIYWNNLGSAWEDKRETDKAIEYYEKALASDLKTFGPAHFTVAIRWNNLGSAWQDKGEVNQAIEYYEKALASDLKTFDPEHPSVARAWNNLGFVWQDKGDTGKAREYYEKALAVYRKAGLEHRVQLVEKNIRSLPPA